MVKSTVYLISHIGTTRENHEDNFLVFGDRYIDEKTQKLIKLGGNTKVSEFAVEKSNKALLSVSDGMGGHNSGEIASLVAVSMLSKNYNLILSFQTTEEIIKAYQECVNNINLELLRLGRENRKVYNMGATLTTLIISSEVVVALNIGDSRIYRFDGVSLSQITKDHTEGQRLLDLKLLTSEEVKKFPSRKSLCRYLGMKQEDMELKADFNIIDELGRKEWFILCSDGLTDVLNFGEIEKVIKAHFKNEDVELAVTELVESALHGINGKSGGTDNITVMIAKIER